MWGGIRILHYNLDDDVHDGDGDDDGDDDDDGDENENGDVHDHGDDGDYDNGDVHDDDDDDDDDDDGDDDDDDDDERKMMMWMLRRRRRRRKMMMLRRKTDPQDRETHFAWACEVEMHMDISKELFILYGNLLKNGCGHPLAHRFVRAYVTRAILCGNLKGKCRTRIPGTAFCASLHNRNAHGHFTRAFLYINLQEKCP